MSNKALDHLPYLHSLEHAEHKIDSEAWSTLGCLPIIGTAIWWWITGNAAISLIVIFTLLAIMFLLLYLTQGKAITCADGISYNRPLRNRYIAWMDVVDAHTRPAKKWMVAEISSNTTTIRLPISSSVFTAKFEASIWQHLRRYARAERYAISDCALSIWSPIPEDIPEELDYFDDVPDDVGTATRYELRGNYILQEYVNLSPRQVQAMEKKNVQNPMLIRWDDVVDARLDLLPGDYEYAYFIIESSGGRTMHITIWDDDTEDYSGDIAYIRFLLAVTRRARNTRNKPAIPIDSGMRKACGVKLPTEL